MICKVSLLKLFLLKIKSLLNQFMMSKREIDF